MRHESWRVGRREFEDRAGRKLPLRTSEIDPIAYALENSQSRLGIAEVKLLRSTD